MLCDSTILQRCTGSFEGTYARRGSQSTTNTAYVLEQSQHRLLCPSLSSRIEECRDLSASDYSSCARQCSKLQAELPRPLLWSRATNLRFVFLQACVLFTHTDYLLCSVLEDPELFGYEIPPDEAVFLPKSGCKDVFHLKILGEGELGIPNALKHVVIQRSGALYPDYIAEVGHSDLLVPAFAHDGYILSKASSSVGMALTAKIPLLLAKADLRAYSFLDSRVTFLRYVSLNVV